MLVLTVLGLLAVASPSDTALRVPGTTLRLGTADTVMAARGFAPAGPGVRKGRCRFFGLASDATLAFEKGRLARAEFKVSGASSYEVSYVRDQLTAMGYRRNCETSLVCVWNGRTRVRVAVQGDGLTASVVPPGSEFAVAPGEAAPAAGPAAGGNAVAQPRSNAATAEAMARSLLSGGGLNRGATPTAPARAAAPPASRDSLRLAAPVPAPNPAPRESLRAPAPAPLAVPMLPETLAVPTANRPSAYAPARLTGEAREPVYPPAALEAGIQGRVWVIALADTDGRVMDASVLHGVPELNDASLEAVRQWRFVPRTLQGIPCRFRVLAPVAFTIH
jgi:TonB family protein